MRRFTPEQAAAALELEQFVSDYWFEIDTNGGRNVADYWYEDGVFKAGTAVDIKGLAGIQGFYARRKELIRTEQKDGVRTSRHTSVNNRISFQSADEATLSTTVLNYSGPGAPPLFGGAAPTIVSDATLSLRRDAKGDWRIFAFVGAPVFVGDDKFQNERLLGRAEPA